MRASASPAAGCDMVMELGFGACKLQVQVPQRGVYATSADLVGKTIGTSFPNLTRQHFALLEVGRSIRTKVVELSGSVEAACALGVADAIVDLVGKGVFVCVDMFSQELLFF